MSALDVPGSHENVPEVGWDVESDLIEEIAHLVWKQGHYSTPWDGWYYKSRWWNVAREILAMVAEADRQKSPREATWHDAFSAEVNAAVYLEKHDQEDRENA